MRLIDADKLLDSLNRKAEVLLYDYRLARDKGMPLAEEIRNKLVMLRVIIGEIERGVFNPDPIPLPTIKPQLKIIDQTTRGTDDADEVGEVVQELINAYPGYNKIYVTKLMPDDWEIVGRLEVRHGQT